MMHTTLASSFARISSHFAESGSRKEALTAATTPAVVLNRARAAAFSAFCCAVSGGAFASRFGLKTVTATKAANAAAQILVEVVVFGFDFAPQCGHAAAWSLTWAPHSWHLIRAIRFSYRHHCVPSRTRDYILIEILDTFELLPEPK
jgi:hypothetical protein